MQKLKMLLAASAVYMPAAFAATKAHHDDQNTFFILCALVLPPLAYSANKWRLWWVGFQLGMADKSDFFSSIKWTFGSVIWTGSIAFIVSKLA